MEFIITGFLMLVVCAVKTTKRTTEELEGLIIGATVTLNVIFVGYQEHR
ncbi:Aquaporin NIP2-1 [Arabidopsis thaliana]